MKRDHLVILGAAALLTLAAGWFVLGRSRPIVPPGLVVRVPATASAAPRQAGAPREQKAALAPPAAARFRQRPQLRTLPTHLDRARMRPAFAGQLRSLETRRPNAAAHIDGQLDLLARVRACLGPRGDEAARGAVHVLVHFQVDADGAAARATKMEIIDSTVPATIDRALIACRLHEGLILTLAARMPAGETRYYWGTRLDLPTHTDEVYRWFQ